MTSVERHVVEYKDKGQTKFCTAIDKIETPTEAYIIGILAADGGYAIHKNKYEYMTFYTSQEWAAKRFNEYFIGGEYTCRIRDIDVTNNIGKTYHYRGNVSYEYHIPGKSSESLKKFGIVCRKPDRVLAGIGKERFKTAVLGFLDGDGSIVVRKRFDCRTDRLNIIIVSGALKILNHIQRHLENELNIASTVYVRSERRHELRIENTKSAILFCNWIYSDLPMFYDKKKKAVFDQYMKTCVRSDELLEGAEGP